MPECYLSIAVVKTYNDIGLFFCQHILQKRGRFLLQYERTGVVALQREEFVAH